MVGVESTLVVDSQLPEAQLHAAVKAACRELLPGWGTAGGGNDDAIAISFIAGGIRWERQSGKGTATAWLLATQSGGMDCSANHGQ